MSNTGLMSANFEGLIRKTLLDNLSVRTLVKDRVHAVNLPDIVSPVFPLITFDSGIAHMDSNAIGVAFADVVVGCWSKVSFSESYTLNDLVYGLLQNNLITEFNVHAKFKDFSLASKVIDSANHAFGILSHYTAQMVVG